MKRINSKNELAQFLSDKRLLSNVPEVVDLIDEIITRYLPRTVDKELNDKELAALFYNKMLNVYREFSFRVLNCAPDFTAKDAKALNDVINFLRVTAEASNKNNGIYRDYFQVNEQVLTFWKLMLSEPFWNKLPEFYKNKVYISQMRPFIKNYYHEMKGQFKNSETAKELRKIKDQQDLAALMQMGNI